MRRPTITSRFGGGAITAAVLVVVVVVGSSSPALAHGIGGRSDLPLPVWMLAYGAAAVLLLTFVGLSAFWRQPKLEGASEGGRDLGDVGTGARRALLLVGRVVGLASLLLLGAAGLVGENAVNRNLAPVGVYVVFWVGLQLTCALVGDLWRVVNPFDTIAAALERVRRSPVAEYRWGHWPAVAAMVGFLWLELVYPYRAEPRVVGTAIAVYTVLVVAAALRWGRSWIAEGEAFTALFGLLGQMAPLGVDDQGRLRLRAPLRPLTTLRGSPALIALVCTVLGSTTFDGITRTRIWTDATIDLDPLPLAAFGTIGLAWSIAVVGLAYVGAMRVTARIMGSADPDRSSGDEPGGHDSATLGRAFVHSLVPILLAYAVAHYFSLFVFEGQAAIALASDPLGFGWDLFGTARDTVNFTLVSTTTIAYVQAGGILVGHLAGVVLAHDRALALFPPAHATRSQYPLLVAMVVYTVGGLALLIGT